MGRTLLLRFGWMVLAAALACGGGGDGGGGGGGGGGDGGGGGGGGSGPDACSEDQVAVGYLSDEGDEFDCHPIPAECGDVADCAVNDCRAALYDLCESPWTGVACSDTFPPTIVSCNQ